MDTKCGGPKVRHDNLGNRHNCTAASYPHERIDDGESRETAEVTGQKSTTRERHESSAHSLINSFTHSFPGSILHPGLKSLALERRLAKPKHPVTFSLGDDSSETLLDVSPNRGAFFCRESLRLVQE